MPLSDLHQLDDHARLWAYAFDTTLTPEQSVSLQQSLENFLDGWRSHGTPVKGRYTIIEDRIIIIAADMPSGQVSGCGIDASVRILKDFKTNNGVDALNFGLIHFRDKDGQIQSVSRKDFKQLVADGVVVANTKVFDLTITELGSLRQGRFELAFKDSWHARSFR